MFLVKYCLYTPRWSHVIPEDILSFSRTICLVAIGTEMERKHKDTAPIKATLRLYCL
jgi:hypothetical protein